MALLYSVKMSSIATLNEDTYKSWVNPRVNNLTVDGTITNKEPHKCEEIKWFDLNNIPENWIEFTPYWIQIKSLFQIHKLAWINLHSWVQRININ